MRNWSFGGFYFEFIVGIILIAFHCGRRSNLPPIFLKIFNFKNFFSHAIFAISFELRCTIAIAIAS
jgi:hypothetical protein